MDSGMFENNLATKLRVAMAINKISSAQLARDIGVSSSAIREICKGATNPRADTLTCICRQLNISADYLLGLKEAEE